MIRYKIPFNKPFIAGNELQYIKDAVMNGKISGDGKYTILCQKYFEEKYGFQKVLLTTSCTDALEMCAILIDIQPGDEIIMPSFTFVSTANAFILRGAKIVFCDSQKNNPHIDIDLIAPLITAKTKAIVVVHYGGVACDMQKLMQLKEKYNLLIIEDAAQAIDSYYYQKPLGGIGDLGTLSFHETKNIISGEGGALIINNKKFIERAEIIREKGTNRNAFFRGEINKYDWIDIGSSFLPSEIIAAFLYGQLENLDFIQDKRKKIWRFYYEKLQTLEENLQVQLPNIPSYATNNGHLFFLVLENNEIRDEFIEHLKSHNILSVFHYQSLHKSEYYREYHDGRILSNSEKYSERLVRLPLFFNLKEIELEYIVKAILIFFK